MPIPSASREQDRTSGQFRARAARNWSTTRWLTFAILLAWFGITFVLTWFAPSLDTTILGWPLPYYMGAQGAPLVYLLLIAAYTWLMNRADRRDGLDPESPS